MFALHICIGERSINVTITVRSSAEHLRRVSGIEDPIERRKLRPGTDAVPHCK